MSRLKNTSDLVKEVLQDVQETRSSDDLLYIEVCGRINPTATSFPFQEILRHRKDLGFPPFESVRRARQKIQQHSPELCATEEAEGYRTVEEEKYRSYARQMNV